jgi:hypothetical protein
MRYIETAISRYRASRAYAQDKNVQIYVQSDVFGKRTLLTLVELDQMALSTMRYRYCTG